MSWFSNAYPCGSICWEHFPCVFFADLSFSVYIEFFSHTQKLRSQCCGAQHCSTAFSKDSQWDCGIWGAWITSSPAISFIHGWCRWLPLLRAFCAHGWHLCSSLPSWWLCLLLQGLTLAVSRTSWAAWESSGWVTFPSGGQSLSVWFASCMFFIDSLNLIEEKNLMFLVDEELLDSS